MKVTFLRNLATVFYRENQCAGELEKNDNKPHMAGETHDVSKEFGELVIEKGLAEAGEPLRATPAARPIHGVPDESPVSDSNADEAIASIALMRSRDKLQHIIDNDKRVTVVDAAKKRISQL